ncbi:hypothetical protein [Phenylobacterium sp.]|jgi:hypothetical protein|uniref:hypothetical protein n=1 Tax=Phenylobacterium sp. TaxID=1871053 RepID=UPI001208E7C7|nr:hypothetical protein [Phenylobacterium sp.]THD57179.1 MAG: hypothetical protein E8A12_13840 [Phenylobacterium sp.]
MATTTMETPRSATPWHLWVVGVIALLWNGFGGYDFVMSNLGGGQAYLHSMKMTDGQIAAMHALPAWMLIDWSVGVWGSVLGSILLLLRVRWAVHAFVASLAGLLISIAYYHSTANGKLMAVTPAFSAVLVAVCLLLVWYAWMMAKRGVLR